MAQAAAVCAHWAAAVGFDPRCGPLCFAFTSDLLPTDDSCPPFAHTGDSRSPFAQAVTVVADMGDVTLPKTYRQAL
eukprot:scaffold168577_cov33-Tisochrysis_lutea.AAC.1